MTNKTGWFNKNKLGNSPKYESYRHALASKGIKTNALKSPKGFSSSGVSTPNFDMVAKGIKVNVGVLTRALEKQGYSNTEITRKGNYYYVLHILKNGTPMLLYKTDDKKDLLGYIDVHYPKYSKNKKTDMISTGLRKSLETMPTLHSGHTDDLKIETKDTRVWVSRVDNSVTTEKLKDGCWVVAGTDMIIGKGIDFPMAEFHKGLKVEAEHGKTVNYDPITMGRIALDHLEEDKQYYRKLAIMEKNIKNPKFDMSAGDIGSDFFRGVSKAKAGNLKIVETPKTTQLVGYNHAVYGERDKKTGKVTFYKGWDKFSSSTSGQLTKVGLRDKADIIVDKRKEVGFDMSLTSLTKSLKKASKGVSKSVHNISKKIEKHNIQREVDLQKQLNHDIEVAKQQLKLKKMQAKSDILEMKHKESVQRQRQELVRINKELEKGTAKAKAKDITRKAGKEGLKLAGLIVKGVAKEVKEMVSTEPSKKKR